MKLIPAGDRPCRITGLPSGERSYHPWPPALYFSLVGAVLQFQPFHEPSHGSRAALILRTDSQVAARLTSRVPRHAFCRAEKMVTG